MNVINDNQPNSNQCNSKEREINEDKPNRIQSQNHMRRDSMTFSEASVILPNTPVV